MRLLFDENLSPTLVRLVDSAYPGSQHVEQIGLRGLADRVIQEHAGKHSLIIVSKDNDFRQISALLGPPPKVIWLAVGNAGTAAIATLLLERTEAVRRFALDPEDGLLVLSLLHFGA